jgi:hypothetical protein
VCRIFGGLRTASWKDECAPHWYEQVRGAVQVVRYTRGAMRFLVGGLRSERLDVPHGTPVENKHGLIESPAHMSDERCRRKSDDCSLSSSTLSKVPRCGNLPPPLVAESMALVAESVALVAEFRETVKGPTRFVVGVQWVSRTCGCWP